MYISYTVIHGDFSLYNACFATISSQKLPLVFTLMLALVFHTCHRLLHQKPEVKESILRVFLKLQPHLEGQMLEIVCACLEDAPSCQQIRFIHPQDFPCYPIRKGRVEASQVIPQKRDMFSFIKAVVY